MRVLHVPYSVGGNPQGLARAERAIGLDSVSVAFTPSAFGYPVDVVLDQGTGRFRRLKFEQRRMRTFWHALARFDVVHFNFGRTLAPSALAQRDMWLLRKLGKVIAVTFQGDDARHGGVVPPWPSLQSELPDRYGPAVTRERRRRIAAFEKFADLIWYLNPDLAQVLPARARFMSYAHVDPREWRPDDGSSSRRAVTVVHAPSDPQVKGTAFVESAVSALRADGVAIELTVVQGMKQPDVRRALAAADVAVDQLFAGWYGGFAVEAMAMEVPVVSYIRRSDLDVLPRGMREELPVVSATPDSLGSVLRAFVHGRSSQQVGRASRRFVERWHDPLAIARETSRAYESALRRRKQA